MRNPGSLRLPRPACALVLLALAACSPKHEVSQDADAYLRAMGYSRGPQVTAVTGAESTADVTGQSVPGGRVRFLDSSQRAIGVTADSRGHFEAQLPLGTAGGLYDVSVDDGGRLVQAEGRLFVPRGAPQKAVIVRAGSPSTPVYGDASPISVMDFDSTGALVVTGKVPPKTEVTLSVDGQGMTTATSDAKGLYYMQVHVAPPAADATMSLSIEAAGVVTQQSVPFFPADVQGGDRMVAVPGGWRVDWTVPGGGVQTTVVF